jgi:hypothetical protein
MNLNNQGTNFLNKLENKMAGSVADLVEHEVEQVVDGVRSAFQMQGGSGPNMSGGQGLFGGNHGGGTLGSHGLFSGQMHRAHFSSGAHCIPHDKNPWTSTLNGNNTGTIDLGDYKLDLNKANSGWTLTNKKTGAVTNVSGDPHVSEDGQRWDFKKDMTFKLDDGTQISVHTKPWGNGMTVSDGLDIVKGDKAIRVTGLDQGTGEPLHIEESFNGRSIAARDAQLPTVYEVGHSWESRTGQIVNEAYAERNLD